MINELLSTPSVSLLERTLNFTEARHGVLLENIANVSTPGYVQRDVSVRDFQRSLQDAVERRRSTGCGRIEPASTDTVEFVPGSSDVVLKPKALAGGTTFYDRGVRNMETLMSQLADNAQAHNMAAAFLKGRYETLRQAITMKV